MAGRLGERRHSDASELGPEMGSGTCGEIWEESTVCAEITCSERTHHACGGRVRCVDTGGAGSAEQTAAHRGGVISASGFLVILEFDNQTDPTMFLSGAGSPRIAERRTGL